jgi:hypothetical protein
MPNHKNRKKKMGESSQSRGWAQGENRISAALKEQVGERAVHAIEAGKESVQHAVADFPVSTVLASFALGAAAGVLVGFMLFEPREPRWYEKVPDALGRRWLEGFLDALPDSVRGKLK